LPAYGAKTDVVTLRNGDRLTGEVQEVKRGRLALKTDDMGTLKIEWDKVRSVKAAAEFDVEDLEGRRYVGSLDATLVAGELAVLTSAGADVVSLQDVVDIRRVDATFWSRLDGSLDVGASFTSASNLFKLDVAGKIGTFKPGYEFVTNASTTLTTQPDVEDTSRSLLSVVYARRFEGGWAALGEGQLEQNSELGFDLRSSLTAGGGRDLLRQRRNRLLAWLGVSVNREKPNEGESTTNVELAVMVGYDRFAYDFPKIDVAITCAAFQSFSDWGRQRLELEARIQRELVKDFYATLRGYESYDSEPPVEGTAGNDYGLTFALGWTF
jgi:hypothetical protein